MSARPWKALIGLACLLGAAPAHGSEANERANSVRFRFAIPPGWVDASPGTPDAQLQLLPKELVAQAKAAPYALFAADLDPSSRAVKATMNAIVREGAVPLTGAILHDAAMKLEAKLDVESASPNARAATRVVSKELTTLHGVSVGRFELETATPKRQMHQLTYLIPGTIDYALVTYTAPSDDFDAYRTTFELSAAETEGVAAPTTFWERLAKGIATGPAQHAAKAVIGVLALGAVVALLRKGLGAGGKVP